MNGDIAPYVPPPLGRTRLLPHERAERAPRPALVPLCAAGVLAVVLPFAPLLADGSLESFVLLFMVTFYGLPCLAALLAVAGLARLTGSRMVGIGGTVLLAGLAAVALHVGSAG